jgi:hypothetical protein
MTRCKNCKEHPVVEIMVEIRPASIFERFTFCEKHFGVWFKETFNLRKHRIYWNLYQNIVNRQMEIEMI